MRFLVDESTGPTVARWLRGQGHAVFKVYREQRPHKGVVLLRLADERAVIKIDTVRRLLERYSDQLADKFVVVTETRVRFARR